MKFRKIALALLAILMVAAGYGIALKRRGFSARGTPSSACRLLAKSMLSATPPMRGHLVLFIRHLPQITSEELDEMKGLNPKSEADRAEEQQEQEFLKDGGTVPESWSNASSLS